MWLSPANSCEIAFKLSIEYFLSMDYLQTDIFGDYCSDLRLLEKDGGSWRFRHQIIHDYFIDITEESE